MCSYVSDVERAMDQNAIMTSTAQDAVHFPIWATGAMVLGVFAIGSEALVVSPLLKDLSTTFGIGDDRSGLAIAAYGLALGISTPLLGPISDLVSRKLVMVASLLMFAASTAVCAGATSFPMLLIARGICGVAAGLFLPATYAYVGDYVPYAARAKVMGRVMSGWAASLVLGVPLGAVVGQFIGWRGALAVVAGMGLVSALVLRQLLEGRRAPRDQSDDSLLALLTRALRVEGVLPLMLVHFAAMTGFYGMYTYLGSFLRTGLAMGSAGAGGFVLVYGLGFTLATLNAHLVDRIGKPKALIVALTGPAVVMLLLPRVGLHVPAIVSLLLIWGILQGIGMTTTLTIAGGLSAPLRGRISALATCAGYLGMTFGSAFMGALFERDGYAAVGTACATAAATAALVFGWRFLLRRPMP